MSLNNLKTIFFSGLALFAIVACQSPTSTSTSTQTLNISSAPASDQQRAATSLGVASSALSQVLSNTIPSGISVVGSSAPGNPVSTFDYTITFTNYVSGGDTINGSVRITGSLNSSSMKMIFSESGQLNFVGTHSGTVSFVMNADVSVGSGSGTMTGSFVMNGVTYVYSYSS